MQNAYKCNACGLISYNPGKHHDQPMVRVVVEDNIRIGVTGPPVPAQPVGTKETAEETKEKRHREEIFEDSDKDDPTD